MFGNYPVNDDWIFVWQVKAFSEGIYKLSAILEPAFISQGFMGLAWSQLFGLSYISLQTLTFLISLITCYFLYKTLLLLKVKKTYAFMGALLLLLNPLFFVSSFTFMTDNYFLLFLSLSTYYFIQFLLNKSNKTLIVGSTIALFSVTTRQIGVLLYIPLLFVILLDIYKKPSKELLRYLFILLFFTITSAMAVHFWPRFGVHKGMLDTKYLLERLELFKYIPQYFVIFLSPILIGIQVNMKYLKNKIILGILVFTCAYVLYSSDFFPLGNVLYLEELYAKSDFRSSFSLFDNIYTKVILAVIWGIAFAKAVFYFGLVTLHKLQSEQFYKKITDTNIYLLFLFLSNVLVLCISPDIYDRYLLPALFFGLLFAFTKLGTGIKKVPNNYYVYFGILAIISIVLQWEFASKTTLMWKQAIKLREERNLSTSISFSDTYINHFALRESGDFTGLKSINKGYNPTCFIQEYTLDASSKIFKMVEDSNSKLSKKVIENPKPPFTRKKTLPRIKNNLDKLVYNQEYKSVLYLAVGKRSFVGTFCK